MGVTLGDQAAYQSELIGMGCLVLEGIEPNLLIVKASGLGCRVAGDKADLGTVIFLAAAAFGHTILKADAGAAEIAVS